MSGRARPKMDWRVFSRAARQRLEAAQFLLATQAFRLEAMYLAGYAIECALKALILARVPQRKSAEHVSTFSGTKAHSFEHLLASLVRLRCNVPRDVIEAIRTVNTWSTDLRYAAGIRDYVVAKRFVDAAACVCAWLERSIWMGKLLKENRSFIRDVRRILKECFPADAIEIYRYNPACIRVRVVDERFEGKTIPEREEMVLPLIRKLPVDVQAEITVLLLLPPSEVGQSLMNLEFERPTRSQL